MFIAIPVGMNYRTERLPLVTLSLIAINTLVWLVSVICFLSTDGESELWIYRHLWLIPGACTWCAPFTSMFVHEGFFHLLGNMIYLFLFGACVEDIIGRLRFTVFYLLGGLVAELVYIGMLPAHFQSLIPMGGASGAVSACMGMYLLLRAGAEIEIKYFLWMLAFVRAGEFDIPAWVAITFWFGMQLLSAGLDLLLGHGHGGGVAFGAHVGGFLAGLALVAAYQKWSVRAKRHPNRLASSLTRPNSVGQSACRRRRWPWPAKLRTFSCTTVSSKPGPSRSRQSRQGCNGVKPVGTRVIGAKAWPIGKASRIWRASQSNNRRAEELSLLDKGPDPLGAN